MFKKQARAWSAILVVCMLLSLLATFALPVSAEGEPALYFDEVVSATGLIDATGYPDISSYNSIAKVYKVSNRAGLEKLNSLVLSGNTLAGVTVYQAADIDLKWENFPGIGANGKVFSGTYKGNGFTIDGLYVQNAGAEGAGLFNDAKGASFWDIHIASGLIIGGMRAGSIVGGYEKEANLSFYNCSSAATVVGGGNNGTGGLAGTSTGASAFYNCYFLGMVYSRDPYPAGLTGYVEEGFYMENSFNYGEMVEGINLANSASYADGIHTVMLRPSDKTKVGTVGVNNYYRKHGRMKSTYDSFNVNNEDITNDNAVGYSQEDFANGVVAEKLNGPSGQPQVGQADGYIMRFTQSEAGYPVATYFDKNTLEPIVKRTAHTTTNVGKNTLAEKSELFRYVSENLGKFPDIASLGNYEIDNAYDLFAMSLLTSFRGVSNKSNCFTNLGLTGITITADIDMAEMKDLFPIDNFVPLGSTNPFTIPLDGQNHVIKNWKTVSYVMPQIENGSAYTNTYTQTGFIAMGAGEIKNLGLADAKTVLDYQLESEGTANPAGGLMVGYQSGALEINGCYATGEVIARNAKVLNYNSDPRNEKMGALLGFDPDGTAVFAGSWADAKLKAEYTGAPFTENKLTVCGSTDAGILEENMASVYYFADTDEIPYGSYETRQYQKRITEADDVKMAAVELNQIAGSAVWGVENNKLTFATAENAVVGVYYQKVGASGYKGGAPEIQVAKPGEIIVLPTFASYEPDPASYPDGVENGRFVMPARNVEIQYIANTYDRDLVQSIYDHYGEMDESLFTGESVGALKNIKNYAKYLLENADTLDAKNCFALQTQLEEFVMNLKLELVAVYPNIPAYSDYEQMKEYNTSGVWAISSKEDWIALTNVPVASFDAHIELHLTNDIDMKNEPTMPMYYGGIFSGVIDGHGYAFKNLNVTMADTNPNLAIGGLVSQMQNATIRNLGVESGIVSVTNHQPSSDNYGVGVITGYSTGSTFTRVWVDSGMTLELNNCKNNSSYAVIAGRGHNIFESCYSYCKIRATGNPNHVSHMGDWVNGASGQLNNCFGVTDVNSGVNVYMYRANSSVNNVQTANNLWIVGGKDVKHSSTIARNSGKLSKGAEKNGVLAYRLWANYVDGRGTRNYYTVENGKTVFGTRDTQYYRLRITKDSTHTDYYGKPGTVIDISNSGYDANYLQIQQGSVGTLNGLKVTMGEGDMNLKVVIPGGANLSKLDEALNYYKVYNGEGYITDFSCFKNGDALKAKLDDVIAKYDTYKREDQAEIDSAAAFLKNGYVLDNTKIIPASYSKDFCKVEGDKNYPRVGIFSLADLKFMEAKSSVYAYEQTVYLGTDLNLADSDFNTLENLRCAFDGQGHTITDYLADSYGFFQSYDGSGVRNVTFDFTRKNIAKNKKSGSIIANDCSYDGAIFEGITIKNGHFLRTSSGSASGGKRYDVFGLILGQTFAKKATTLTIRDCVVENNTFSVTSTGYGYGFLVGQNNVDSTLNIENVMVINNTFGSKGGGKGYVVGRSESTTTKPVTNIKNALVYGNTGGNFGLFGEFWSKATDPGMYAEVDVQNVFYYNNAGSITKYLDSGYREEFSPIHLSGSGIYSDNGEVFYNSAVDYTELPDINALGFREGMTVVPTAELLDPEWVYNYNEDVKDDPTILKLALKDGDLVYASETNQVPHMVTVGTEPGAPVFYTDANGKLAGDTSGIAALSDCSFDVGDPLNHVFTGNTTIHSVPHNVPVVEEPGSEGMHTGECVNCHKSVTLPCVEEEGYPKPYSDPQIKSALQHRCKICQNEWLTDIDQTEPTLTGAASWKAPVNSVATIPVKTINFPAVASMVLNITYDKTAVTNLEVVAADQSCTVETVDTAAGKQVTVTNQNPNEGLEMTADGVLFDLVLTTGAAGTSSVDVAVQSVTDSAMNPVPTVFGFTTELTVHEKKMGDVDQNGVSDMNDVVKMMRYLLEMNVEGTFDVDAADINGDQVIDLLDVVDLCHTQSMNP